MTMARIQSTLRSGDWASWARIRAWCAMLGIAFAGTWAYLLTGAGHLDPLGRAVGTDFAAFYAISRALLDGAPAASLYSPAALNELVRPFTNGSEYVWLYPPIAFAPYWPVGLLPYLAALAAWNCVGLAAYLAAVWRVVPGLRALAVASIFPAVFVATMHGHNGLLIAASFGFGLVLLPTRPVAAGLLLGLVSIKPHLAVLVPVALLVGRQWRAIAAAGASALSLTAIVIIAFGVEPWRAFIRSTVLARALLETGGVPYSKISSSFSSIRLVGGTVGLAYALQGAVAIAAAAAVVWLWSTKSRYELRAAGLICASLIATPYVYDYDLVVLGVGLGFLASVGLRDGWLDWEKTAIAVAWAVPLLARVLATWIHVPITPVVLAWVLALTIRRAVRESALRRPSMAIPCSRTDTAQRA
jgi:glycosyl transferase family 87